MMQQRIRMKSVEPKGSHGVGPLGPHFVLIHGYGGSPRQWEPVASALSSYFQVHILQISALFDSKKPLLFGLQVELLIRYIEDTFKGEPVYCAGISYGSTLLWAAQLRRPELFHFKFLINPLLPQAMKWMESSELKFLLRIPFSQQTLHFLLSTSLGKNILKKSSELFRPGDQQFLGRIKRMDRRMIYYVSSMIIHFSWVLRNEDWTYWESLQMPDSKYPTHLIVSDKDPLFVLKNYEEFFRQQIPLAKWSAIQDAGHLIQITHPEKLVEIILESTEIAKQKKSA